MEHDPVKRRMRAILLGLFCLGCAAAAACGGDDDDCQATGQRVCDLACDCTEGEECKILLGAVTLTHDTPGDCTGFWVDLTCSQDESDEVDYGDCNEALDSAECVETAEGMALMFPSSECGDSQ